MTSLELAGLQSFSCEERHWASLTTLHAGLGRCFLLQPDSPEELEAVVRHLKESRCRPVILGNGSNLAGSDQDGLTVLRPTAHCGNAFQGLSSFLREHAALGQGGYAALAGIPGTVGGAVRMNAGAMGCEFGPGLAKIRGISLSDGCRGEYSFSLRDWQYRTAPLPEDFLVTDVECSWKEVSPDEERERIQGELLRRKNVTPEGASAGSVFRNPGNGLFAGKVLEEAGCKGLKKGVFSVSLQHANWIVNLSRQPGAAADVRWLVEEMQRRSPVFLQPELKFLS